MGTSPDCHKSMMSCTAGKFARCCLHKDIKLLIIHAPAVILGHCCHNFLAKGLAAWNQVPVCNRPPAACALEPSIPFAQRFTEEAQKRLQQGRWHRSSGSPCCLFGDSEVYGTVSWNFWSTNRCRDPANRTQDTSGGSGLGNRAQPF